MRSRNLRNLLLSLPFLIAVALSPSTASARRAVKALPDEGFKLRSIDKLNMSMVDTLLALQLHHSYIKPAKHRDVAKLLRKNGWKIQSSVVESKMFIRGYVARKKNDLVICFRGTGGNNGWQTFRNWLTDFRAIFLKRPTFLKKPRKGKKKRKRGRDHFSGVKGHRGFIKAYNSVRSGILKRVKANPRCRVWVTGFSLGGALANLCALDLRVNKGIKSEVVLFGSPRVGNNKYKSLFAKMLPNAMRVVSDKDPVPRVPSDGRFRHNGRLLQIYPSGKPLKVKNVSGAVLGKKIKVGDHSRDKYRAMLKAFRKRAKKGVLRKLPRSYLKSSAKQEEKNRNTIRHLAGRTGKGIKRDAKAVGKGAIVVGKKVGKGAKTVGKGVVKGAKVVGKGAVTVGRKVGKGAKKAGKAIGKGAKKVGSKIKGLFTRKKKKKKKKKSKWKLW